MCPAPAKSCFRKVNEILSGGTCIESNSGQGRPERAASMCDGVEKTKADFPGDGSQLAAGTSGLEWSAECNRAATTPTVSICTQICTQIAFWEVLADQNRLSKSILNY